MIRMEMQGLPACEPDGRHWFWHGEQVLALLDVHRPKVCVELGTHRGGSAIAVARLVRQWGGMVYGIDRWTDDVRIEHCQRNIREAGVADSIILTQMDSVRASMHWPAERPIDYLYIDADHSHEGCLADLRVWWRFLRRGGLIAGDDYDDPRWGVTPAWDEFEKEIGQTFERKATPGSDPACTRLIWGIK
jgi:cephalosporin hydroxylase